MEVGKVIKRGEDFFDFFFFFFFFFFSPLKTTDICFFWSNKNGNFLPGKNILRREKIRKNDFAPSEKYACYAPDQLVYSVIKIHWDNIHI